MTFPNDNPRGTKKRRINNKSVGWAIAGAVVLVMFGLMFIARAAPAYAGRGAEYPSAAAELNF